MKKGRMEKRKEGGRERGIRRKEARQTILSEEEMALT